MSTKINRITVDIDDLNFYDLFRAYLNAKKILKDNIKKIETYWSPSGRGFHLEIELKKEIQLIDNIITRACLNDDTFRLRYSLKKYFMKVYSGVDISFNYKNGKYSKPFEIPKNLTEDNLEELANEYYEKYKNRELNWELVEFNDDSLIDKYHEKGQELKQKYGWNYKIVRNPYKKSKWLFILYHNGQSNLAKKIIEL